MQRKLALAYGLLAPRLREQKGLLAQGQAGDAGEAGGSGGGNSDGGGGIASILQPSADLEGHTEVCGNCTSAAEEERRQGQAPWL